MPDHLTPEQRFRAMSRVKLKDGPLEAIVRSGLHRRGYRFRKHVKRLPGSPDAAFPKERIAIFVDGDFWHGYYLPKWEHKLSSFWREKIAANRKRDERNFRKLRKMGWRVIRIWQHEINADLQACLERIIAAVESSPERLEDRKRVHR